MQQYNYTMCLNTIYFAKLLNNFIKLNLIL